VVQKEVTDLHAGATYIVSYPSTRTAAATTTRLGAMTLALTSGVIRCARIAVIAVIIPLHAIDGMAY